jgi:hypothetical protein
MATVSFKKGLLASLPATKTAGTFYVTTDERAMYLDVDASTRIRLGDFQEFASVAALTANTNPNTSALYYVSDINCLAKWNGAEYVQINKDTGMTSIEVAGDGNAITAAVYDANGRKLTLTKGATYMTAADVDGKISDKVGTLKIGDTTYDTVVAYVNKKAEDTLSAAQGGSSETAASVKQALDNYKTENDAKVQANADAIDAIEADYLKAADKEALQADIDTKAAQTDLTALSNKVGTVADGKTVVGMIGDVETAYQAKDTELAVSIKTISDDYLTSADKTELQGNIDKKVDQTVYNAKISALETADTTLQTNIDNEAKARKDADDAQVARIATLEGQITGLSGAMHFEGVKTEVPTDVTGYEAGDVIIVGEKEYVFNGTAFVEFGDVSAEGERITTLETTVGDATSGLVKSVADNTTAITAEETRAKATEAANKALAEAAQVAAADAQADVDAIAADYLKASDKTELQGNIDGVSSRVTTLEGTSHTHVNKALLDTYTQTEADLADAVAKKHSHDNKTVLDDITAEKVSAWDSAQANAEATAAGALSDAKTALETEIAKKANSSDVYLKTETLSTDEIHALMQWGEF